jgi:hypothetical protein
MANNYISLKTIVDKVLRHPLMAGISFETIIDYTVDFLRIVKHYAFFENKTTTITIEKYKGLLPDDFYEVVSIYRGDIKYSYNANSKDKQANVYKIQGGYIYTDLEKGELELEYQAILIDEEGYPLIPDNSKFTRALEAYIKKQWFTILFDMGKLQPAILQNIQQEYAWAVGACESEFHYMTLDKADNFYNMWSNASYKGLNKVRQEVPIIVFEKTNPKDYEPLLLKSVDGDNL